MPEYMVGAVHSWGTDWRAADDERHARKILAGLRRHGVPLRVIRVAGPIDVTGDFIAKQGE